MAEKENNIYLSGDEARMLMATLLNSSVSLPAGITLQLYVRLANLSNVQPPVKQLPQTND